MSAIQQIIAAGGAVIAPPGQVLFENLTTVPTEVLWVVPAGVTRISVVAVGAGSIGNSKHGGGGGALSYVNNISVTPGETLKVTPAESRARCVSGDRELDYAFNAATSVVRRGAVSLVAAGGGRGAELNAFNRVPGGLVIVGTGGVGGDGGFGGAEVGGGAGGAGGYVPPDNAYYGCGGDGMNGAAGGSPNSGAASGAAFGYGGGGVGLKGLTNTGQNSNSVGNGGSGGTNGSSTSGGTYGGGGPYPHDALGGRGAVRIIWPGDERVFPSTRTADE